MMMHGPANGKFYFTVVNLYKQKNTKLFFYKSFVFKNSI